MELVTGRKGTPHVTSQQDRIKNQGIFGADSYILNTGKKLAPEVQSSNEIRIRDGAIMVQGALGAVKVNTYDSVTIQNGNQGMKRIDLICWQYTYEAERDIESADWIVIQGTPAEADPQQPEHISGSIQEGDAVVQVPVFAVHLDGINVTGVDVLIPVIMTNADLSDSIGRLNANSIVEAGEDSNHNCYIKYANGRLEQWGNVDIPQSQGYGSIKYPIQFVGDRSTEVHLFTQGKYLSETVITEAVTQKQSNSLGIVYVRDLSGNKVKTHTVDWYAIGRWK